MGIISAAGRLYRATEFDAVRPSILFSAQEAAKKTERTNLGNAAMYATNAAFYGSGLINAFVGVGKFGYAMMLMASSLGEKGASQAARMSYAADLMKSGTENMVVGAIACVPFYGQIFAGAMAVRSLADASAAHNNVKLLSAPKS